MRTMLKTKRRLWLFPLILLLALTVSFPAAAQDVSPLDWIPADFSGYVRIDTSDPQATLDKLNLGLYIASVLQPTRFTFTQAQGYDSFVPLTSFDIENASFTQTVMPWLKDEVIFAYRSLDAQFSAGTGDTVMIMPTDDAFASANFLSSVITAQDLPNRATYRDVILYEGDKTAFAFTPSAVLVGPPDLLREVIDTMTGNGDPLTADSIYPQVRGALPERGTISGYLSKDAAERALSVLLSGGTAADQFLSALTESLQGLSKTPDRLLLSGALDGIGFSVDYDPIHSSYLTAEVVVHTVEAPDVVETAFDPSVLDLIPRSAMIVQSGTDAGGVATDALHSLPFLSFAGQALAAFPVRPTDGTPVPVPSAQDAQAAVSSFLETVKPLVDVQSDLIDNLDGSYTVALLPRPNNPMPGSNAPFDVLLVVQTDSPESAQAAQASASKLLETFTAPLEDEALGSLTFRTLRESSTGEPLVRLGTVDNLLVIGTGTAAQLALDAQRGDNRLIGQERWQNLSPEDQIPYVYVDVNAFYNTFLPQAGSPAALPISQLGIHSQYLGDNLFALNLLVGLTQ